MNIRKEISIHCEELKIKKVNFQMVPLKQGEPMAKYVPSERCIYLMEGKKEIDMIFSIAHEMRHAWQFDNHILVDNHLKREMLSVKAYNLQPDEIDANGYATAYTYVVYGVLPTFEGLDKDVIEKIYKRAAEIIAI